MPDSLTSIDLKSEIVYNSEYANVDILFLIQCSSLIAQSK